MSALLQSATNYGTSGSSVTVTLTANVTAGSTLVLCCLAPATGSSVSDSQGNTGWTQIATGNIWYCVGAKAGATTITVNYGTAPGWLTAIASEFTAASAGGGFDQSTYATGTSSTPAGGAITPAVANELVVAYCTNGQGDTAGSGYTLIDNSTGDSVEYAVMSGAGTITATFTQGASAAWYIKTATFKPQGGTLHTQSLSDSFTFSDLGLVRSIGKKASEAFTLSDLGLARSTAKKASDSFTVTDRGLARSTGKQTSDTFTVTDLGVNRATAKSFTETFSITEVFAAAKTKLLALVDAFTLTDRGLARALTKQLSDTFTLAESFAAIRAKVLALADAFTLTDLGLVRSTTKALADSYSLTETLARQVARTLVDEITLADGSLTRGIAKSCVDAFTLSEAFTFAKIGGAAVRRYFAQCLRRMFPADCVTRTFTATGEYMITCDPKPAEALENFLVDWTSILGEDTIAASVWEINEGDDITLGQSSNTNTTATGEFGGGTAGTSYLVKNKITLASGQIKVQYLLIPVV